MRGAVLGPAAVMLCATFGAACGPAPDTGSEIRLAEDARVDRRRPLVLGDAAPPFALETTAGDTIDSAAVFGKRVVVLVFFTSWCKVCARKLPMVREEIATAGDDVMTLAVSLDDPETWPYAPSYLERFGLSVPLVRGGLYPPFVMSYDPSLAIPMVVVVGRDGRVVDVQPGLALGHRERLRAALDVARGRPSATPNP